jgi:exopolysaccharide biosynthesis polyprenyl glycosylphosphotransferase
MKNNASVVYALFLIVGDFLALLAAFTAAYIIRVKVDPRPLIQQIPALTYLRAFLAVLPFWILVHAFIGLYNADVYEKRFQEFGRLFVGSFIGILVVIGYDFVSPENLFPARLVPVYGLVLGFSFLVLFRAIARLLRQVLFHFNIGINNLLIIGDTPIAKHLADALKDTRHTGYHVIGLVGDTEHDLPRFSSLQAVLEGMDPKDIDGIIQTELYADPEKNTEILSFAQLNHISYRFVPGNSDLFFGNIDVELFGANVPVIAVHQTALVGWGRIVKRLFDIAVSGTLLVLLSPVFLLIAVLIKLFDAGPVFFRQERITRFNIPFRIYKFRTMKVRYSGMSPEEAFTKMGKSHLVEKYRKNGDQLEDDPRMSGLGRFLRRWSLDELPQLINVLRGELSLVGPRALVPEEIDQAHAKHHIVSVKSGLTGLAQVSGRRDITYDERRKMDVYYVQNWSFWLDLTILLKTLRAVLEGRGAK